MKEVMTTKHVLVLALVVTLFLGFVGQVKAQDGVWTNNKWIPIDDVSGARILSLALDPTNPQVLYAGLPFGGGVWRSTDGAETWSSCGNNGLPEKADITSLAVDPNNPNHLFAANSRGSEYGLWETTDAGLNWSQTQPGNWGQITGLGSFLYAIKDGTVQSYHYTSKTWSTIPTPASVIALAMHPGNPLTLYATSSNYVNCTHDGGATWASYPRTSGIESSGFTDVLAIHPTQPGWLYMGVVNEYVSVSKDHGATWSRFKYGDDNTPTTLALAGAGYDTLIVMSNRHHQFWGDRPAGTLASPIELVMARVWTQVSNAVAAWGCSTAVAVDRSNPNIVYFGSTTGVIKSTDGGVSFELKATGLRGLTPAFLVDPYDGTLYAADTGYGGLFRSTDGGVSWSRDVEGMWFGPWTNTLPIAFGPDRVYAANNGKAYLYWIYSRERSGSTWERGEGLWRRFSGEGSYVGIVADPCNPGHAYAAHAGPGYYASDTHHYIPHTTDGGQTWSEFCFPGVDGWPTDKPRISSIALEHDETAGQSTLYVALRNPTRLLRRVLTSPGAQWEQVSLAGVNTSSDISRILIPSPTNIYLVDDYNYYLKRLYRSTDGGATWSQITGSALPRDYLADSSALAFSPTDTLRGYARARSSYSSAGEIYSTSDGGASWEEITREGLSDEVLQELRHFAVDAHDPNTLYAGSRQLGGSTNFGTPPGSGWKLTIVKPVNDAPIANAGPDQSVHVGDLVTLDGSGSSDPDEDYPLTYWWQITSKPQGSIAELSDPCAVNPSFIADMLGDYIIELVVTDSLGAESAPDEVLVSTYNTPPVPDPGPDQAIIELYTTVQLDGSKSYDDEGDDFTYLWTITQKPAESLAELDDPCSPTPTFVADIHGDYVISLVVTDIFGAVSEPDSVTVSFENVKPVADAGGNQSVIAGDTVFLDGSGSYDGNFDPLSYSWSFVSKPSESLAELSDANVVNPSFIVDEPGAYVVSLVVNDGFLDSNPANVTIMAITTEEAAAITLVETVEMVNLLDPESLKNKNLSNALTNKINAALAMIDEGLYQDALDKLVHDILQKTNGCADTGQPDKNDWIITCEEQSLVYPLVIETIELLENLI